MSFLRSLALFAVTDWIASSTAAALDDYQPTITAKNAEDAPTTVIPLIEARQQETPICDLQDGQTSTEWDGKDYKVDCNTAFSQHSYLAQTQQSDGENDRTCLNDCIQWNNNGNTRQCIGINWHSGDNYCYLMAFYRDAVAEQGTSAIHLADYQDLCPKADGQIYTTDGTDKQYRMDCNEAWAETDGTRRLSTTREAKYENCMDQCTLLNKQAANPDDRCHAITYHEGDGFCYTYNQVEIGNYEFGSDSAIRQGEPDSQSSSTSTTATTTSTPALSSTVEHHCCDPTQWAQM